VAVQFFLVTYFLAFVLLWPPSSTVNNFITVSDITLFALSYLFVRTAISSKLKVLCCGGGCSHIDSATFL